jgi:lipoprotein-anchoring transpeptidase ErfK/SrfK
MPFISRRRFAFGALSLPLISCPASSQNSFDQEPSGYFDPDLLPPAESRRDFPIVRVDPRKIKKRFRRQVIAYDGDEGPGAVIVDPGHRFLYHVQRGAEAIRYGVGVGRQGFEWSGEAVVGLKRRWPRWVPPADMVERDPHAAQWVNGMPGGPDNPLGARALYLYADGVDTLYRIHGTNEPSSIGKAMSSGCIRMLNQDVAELYNDVRIGTPVYVRPAQGF